MSKHLAPRTCILAHFTDPERPRTATRGHLCEGHYLSLEQLLAELPALNDEATRSLTPIRDDWRTRPANSRDEKDEPLSLRPTALMFDEDVSDAQRKARDFLASWASVVVEEHPDRLHPPRFTLDDVSRFLLRWLPWIVEQPWVDDMRGELLDARGGLRSALAPLRSKKVDLGPCDAPVACDVGTQTEVTCTGIMQAVVRRTDESLPAEIGCTVCGLTKQPSEWRALSRRLRGNKDPMLTAAQLSQMFQVPVGTLQRWAHEDQWRRDDKHPRHYHADDAQASFDRHPQQRVEEAS